jgi:hypothetical protein
MRTILPHSQLRVKDGSEPDTTTPLVHEPPLALSPQWRCIFEVSTLPRHLTRMAPWVTLKRLFGIDSLAARALVIVSSFLTSGG